MSSSEEQTRYEFVSLADVPCDQPRDKPLTKMLKKEIQTLHAELKGKSPPDQVSQACVLYMKMFQNSRLQERENKDLAAKLHEAKRAVTTATQQHEQALQKHIKAKEKLENLCRELQKQNRLLQAQRVKAEEDEKKRHLQLTKQFQASIDSISERMQAEDEIRLLRAKETEELRQKLQDFISQHELREQHHEKALHAKELEVQLLHAKLAQQGHAQKLSTQQVKVYEEQVITLTAQCTDLKNQLGLYSTKFDEIQGTMDRSHSLSQKFKNEVDKMSKTIKQLQKENRAWEQRYEKSQQSVVAALEERNEYAKTAQMASETLQLSKTKMDKLEKLCRALQMERTQLNAQLQQQDPPTDEDEGEQEAEETQQEEPIHSETYQDIMDDANNDDQPPALVGDDDVILQ
eukprot:m.122099 g.122099  ORF g.122099 m.122099 type:complete len:404 (+) comp23309_c0_seq5:119-1330(+)